MFMKSVAHISDFTLYLAYIIVMKFLVREHRAATAGISIFEQGNVPRAWSDNCTCILAQVYELEKFSEQVCISFFGDSNKNNNEPTHLAVFYHEDGRVVSENAL